MSDFDYADELAGLEEAAGGEPGDYEGDPFADFGERLGAEARAAIREGVAEAVAPYQRAVEALRDDAWSPWEAEEPGEEELAEALEAAHERLDELARERGEFDREAALAHAATLLAEAVEQGADPEEAAGWALEQGAELAGREERGAPIVDALVRAELMRTQGRVDGHRVAELAGMVAQELAQRGEATPEAAEAAVRAAADALDPLAGRVYQRPDALVDYYARRARAAEMRARATAPPPPPVDVKPGQRLTPEELVARWAPLVAEEARQP